MENVTRRALLSGATALSASAASSEAPTIVQRDQRDDLLKKLIALLNSAEEINLAEPIVDDLKTWLWLWTQIVQPRKQPKGDTKTEIRFFDAMLGLHKMVLQNHRDHCLGVFQRTAAPLRLCSFQRSGITSSAAQGRRTTMVSDPPR
jgi:hypothetical protein